MYEIWTSTIQLFRSDPTRSKNEEEKIDSLHPYILHSQSTYKMAYESVYMATHMLDAITLRKKKELILRCYGWPLNMREIGSLQ